MIVRVLSLLLAAGGSLDLILGAGFSQLSVSFKNLEVICSAQPSSARPGQETLSPSFSQHRQRQQHTPHFTSTQNTQTKRRGRRLLAAGGGGWEEASVFCPWRPFTVRGQPGPAWATPHNCIILFKVLCWWRAVQPALFSNIEHRVCH